ncbi:putative F-box/LRR-repeat protein At3g18150, partial [Euphorbia lathyris]|uniref:putative F-box/LRR-repeat protein At3g18150 n=1 Tax=Euphorbia lathyris TaxID=212925 RepID=UPI003314046D
FVRLNLISSSIKKSRSATSFTPPSFTIHEHRRRREELFTPQPPPSHRRPSPPPQESSFAAAVIFHSTIALLTRLERNGKQKVKKLKEKEDRISALPDSIIQHILSLLSSTKNAIQTSVLWKRWHKQWTRVPALIFNFHDFSGKDISYISRSIDNTLILHNCLKIQKFHIKSGGYNFAKDPNCNNVKLHFAITKQVEELILEFYGVDKFMFPNFFFNYASLVKLQLTKCSLMPNGRVNWEHLKYLYIESCLCTTLAIASVAAGSPLLESLEINDCLGFDRLAIASKSLKRLVLADALEYFVLEISCPNLVKFYFRARDICPSFRLSGAAIENVLSGSPSLESMELIECDVFEQLVIDSNSLKKLVLVEIQTDAIVISCPNLGELYLCSLFIERIKLINIPSSICATFDFNCYNEIYNENTVRMILEQLGHVKDLNLGRCLIKILSTLEMRSVCSTSINVKCLTFDGGPNFVENLPGIAYALRSSPKLEKLVITLRQHECETPWDFPDLNISGENYWNSKGADFNCLVSHLKIVKIFGLSEHDDQLNLAFNFIEFLLKNTRALEKMVVVMENRGPDFVFQVSQKLLSFSRFSRYSIVELLSSESPTISEYSSHLI